MSSWVSQKAYGSRVLLSTLLKSGLSRFLMSCALQTSRSKSFLHVPLSFLLPPDSMIVWKWVRTDEIQTAVSPLKSGGRTGWGDWMVHENSLEAAMSSSIFPEACHRSLCWILWRRVTDYPGDVGVELIWKPTEYTPTVEFWLITFQDCFSYSDPFSCFYFS